MEILAWFTVTEGKRDNQGGFELGLYSCGRFRRSSFLTLPFWPWQERQGHDLNRHYRGR